MYVQLAYQEYLDEISKNKYKFKSSTLSTKELNVLYNSKYDLTEFEIYLYIKSLDYLRSQDNVSINLNEGITENTNLYRNVLVDLYYQNINYEEIFKIPIAYLFGFKYYNNKPQNIDVLSLDLQKKNK